MKKYLYIEGDTNDGDYITSKYEVTDQQIELIKPVVEAIKNNKSGHNYPASEYQDGNVFDLYGHLEGFNLFEDMRPNGEYGIHTIDTVEILVVQEIINLL